MGYVIGCLMAGVSFLVNRRLLKYTGPQTLVTYSPALEEAVKTVPAYYLGADILVTHLVFGGLEAIYDWREEKNMKAGIFSIIGHSLFGLLTLAGLRLTANLLGGLMMGLVAHFIWNIAVVGIYSPRR